MKWLKLDCDFRNDPKIQALARDWGGQEAAGFWTLLLTFVAAHGGPECRVKIQEGTQYCPAYLAKWFGTYPQQLHKRLTKVASLSLISATDWEESSTLFIPNMLKRVDDYTRKVRTLSEKSPKKVRVEEEVDKEVHRKHIAKPSRYTSEFEAFWVISSQRGSKWEAFQLWEKLDPETKAVASEAMIQCVTVEWAMLQTRLIPHVVRWIRGRRWETKPRPRAATAYHARVVS